MECFAPTDLLVMPELFDESREWDLGIFVSTIRRAAHTEGPGLADITKRLIEFCNLHIVDTSPVPALSTRLFTRPSARRRS